MRSLLFTLFSVATVSCLAYGCSSSSSGGGTTTGTDSGTVTGKDGGTGTGTDSGGGGSDDAGPAALNGCTSYADQTAGTEVDLTWGFTITTDPNHCSKIKAGTKVKWTGDFGTHPLGDFGGDTPNPIATTTVDDAGTSTSITVTFPNAGTFGYHCMVHASMMGAIEVVP
jgi:plastocyanin